MSRTHASVKPESLAQNELESRKPYLQYLSIRKLTPFAVVSAFNAVFFPLSQSPAHCRRLSVTPSDESSLYLLQDTYGNISS